MKKAILIQARLSSSRFPKKMLHDLAGVTLVEYVYNRCARSKQADRVVVITSEDPSDDALYETCIEKKIPVFRGSLDDVLSRYIKAAEHYGIGVVCRVCGDSPFVDIDAVDTMFCRFTKEPELEYMSVTNALNGLLAEVCRVDLLKKIYNDNLSEEDMEHVTKYIRDNQQNYNTAELDLNKRPAALEKYTLTVDYPRDLEIVRYIAAQLNGYDFTSDEIIERLTKMENNEV